MSAAQPIGPGSIVVCISTPQNVMNIPDSYKLTRDALYCVKEIAPWAAPCLIDGCEAGYVLKGRDELFIKIGYGDAVLIGYCPSQFRPLNDGDTSRVVEEETYDDIIGAGLQTYRALESTS